MRILQLSTFDSRFGAAIAARRLHEALLDSGQDCDFLVREKQGNFPRTYEAYEGLEKLLAKARQRIDFLPLKFYRPNTYADFSLNWVSSNMPELVEDYKPDIVHMHWCQPNFVPTPTLLRMGRPIIWTFHDMWTFTGGCHYSDTCEHYLNECGACPVLKSTKANDVSRRLWREKREAYRRIQNSFQVVCPSNWMAGLACNAPLLEGIPVHVVPNPIDTHIFKPSDKIAARRLLGLPEQGHLLLMGATWNSNRRKGFDLLDAALQKYAENPDTPEVGLVMLEQKVEALSERPGKLKVHHLDFVSEETRVAALYNAVDVVALPSREENLSNMLAEALCCGTPCLAFEIGGNGDLITHKVNGYMAKAFDTDEMALGLTWILDNVREENRTSIAKAAHDKVSYEVLVPTFLKIYEDALRRVTPSR
jgi:glycosyltransferase involved in cell wall biosynthesis